MNSDPSPLISLVIPAWNEAAFLPRLLDSVEAARGRYRGGRDRVEVIVADNGSDDDTAAIARARGCVVVTVEKRCIAAARNGGAAAASGELLAFADADFRIDPETFNFIAEAMRRPDVVGGATGLTMERWSLGIRLTWLAILPPIWMFGFDGGVWFCRRADFLSLGGYNEKVRAGEDLRFLRALQKLGRGRRPRQRLLTRFGARRLGLTPPLVVNSARKFDQHGDWHLFRHLLVNLPRLIRGRRAVDEYIEGYWYRDRSPAGSGNPPAAGAEKD